MGGVEQTSTAVQYLQKMTHSCPVAAVPQYQCSPRKTFIFGCLETLVEGAFLVAAVIVDAEFDFARACTRKRTAQNMHGPFCVRIAKSHVLKSPILKHVS